MRIREIRVYGLFDLFDHVIPLQQTAGVTILHGPNGYGKTAVLRLMRALFDCDYAALQRTPFRLMELDLGNEGLLQIERSQSSGDNDNATPSLVQFRLRRQDAAEVVWDTSTPEKRRTALQGAVLAKILSGQERVAEEAALREHEGHSDWRKGLGLDTTLRARLIETQRLQSVQESSNTRSRRQKSSAVELIATDLAELIREQQAAYGLRAQELDRSFPARLLQRNVRPTLSIDDLQQRLVELEAKAQRLVTAGLLNKQSAVAAPVEKVDEEGRAVLSVFVADATEKLSVFDDLLERVELLRDVIGRRFSFKTLVNDGEHGLRFETAKGAPLALDDLSSGEQHELVLLYELLFRVAPGSLVLIDEPELSLHIVWQNEFVDDLTRIVKLRGFDVLLATHSPDIIGKHWDLTVELKAPLALAANA